MHNSGKVLISHALAKRLLPLTLSVFVLISLVLPLSFGAIEYRRLANTAGTHARQLADLITTIAATSPRLWKFQATKYSEVMNTFLPHKGIAAIDILDEGKAPVNQFNHTASHGMFSSWAVEGEPAAIALNNMRIGEVRIRLDASSAALMVALLLSGCVLIGGLLCLFLYRLPLRVVWKLERQLLAYQDSLEDLVRERTDALQDARFKAESANRAKGLFLANMSHEIRTPMNAILGMTHLAMQARSDDQRRHFLETVQHSSESLLGLLNDILDFSKMEAGQLQLNPLPFNLRRLLHGIVSTMGVSATEKGLTLTAHIADDLPEVLIGDDMRLRQILLNLVGNAIKFTSKGAVTISATRDSAGDAEAVHCTVTDSGIGIPADKCVLIFNSFEQADSSHARQFGGTGLGLSVCSQLISLMGGRIWVESREQAGSAFHFTVPLPASSEQPAELPETEQAAPMAIANLRILVVDDNAVNRDVASMTLEQTHEVATAGNGLEALTLLAMRPFDIILMDVQMPTMDGLTATAMIRALEQEQPLPQPLTEPLLSDLTVRLRGGHLPIVAMTAHAMSEDRDMCRATGMDGYITKPFQPAQLVTILHEMMAYNAQRSHPHRERGKNPAEPSSPNGPILPLTMEQVAAHLQRTTGLGAEQISRLLIAARQSLATNLARMEEGIVAGDASILTAAAHTLKGTLLQCGLDELAAIAEHMQHCVRDDGAISDHTGLATLQQTLAGLITAP